MSETCMTNLAIITDECCKALDIRDELKKLDLFKRLSFDVCRGIYVIYLQSVDLNNWDDLVSFVIANNCRLIKYY